MNTNVILHVQLTEAFVSKVLIVPGGCTANIYIGCRNYSYTSCLLYHSTFTLDMYIVDSNLQSSIQPQLPLLQDLQGALHVFYFWLLRVESHIFLKLRKKRTACKPVQIHKMTTTPTPWLTLLLVLGKSRVKQNSC